MNKVNTALSYPAQYCHSEGLKKPEESPGKAPLFVPHARGSLDFARDDVFFGDRHFDQVKRVEKSPKAKQYFVACYHTRRYKSFVGFSIYAKAFDMCCRTRYALKGVMVL